MSAHPLLWPALTEVALITYRDVKAGANAANPIAHLPIPSQYVSVAVVFGLLSLIPDSGARLAATVGWGLVVATALKAFTPGGTVAAAKAVNAVPASS